MFVGNLPYKLILSNDATDYLGHSRRTHSSLNLLNLHGIAISKETGHFLIDMVQDFATLALYHINDTCCQIKLASIPSVGSLPGFLWL